MSVLRPASAPLLKLDPSKGQLGGLMLGDTISRALSVIQMQVHTFGKVDIVASKEDLSIPLFIILQDAGML